MGRQAIRNATPAAERGLMADIRELVDLAAEIGRDHERDCRMTFAIAGKNERMAARQRYGEDFAWCYFANPSILRMRALLRRMQETRHAP